MILTLSEYSLSLLNEYSKACPANSSLLPRLSNGVDDSQLVQWLHHHEALDKLSLNDKKNAKRMEFLLANLHAQLLKELRLAGCRQSKEKQHHKKSAKVKLILWSIVGTLLALFEGFDCTITFLGTFPVAPLIILLSGALLSAVALAVFYSLRIMQVADSVGLPSKEVTSLQDAYLSQMQEVKALRKKINDTKLAELRYQELAQMQKMVAMLLFRLQKLDDAAKQFNQIINSPTMKVAKTAFALAAGLLFFGGGFGAGQSVAFFAFSLFMGSISATFWPVLAISVLAGVLSFLIYWQLEHKEVQKVISNWAGLDEEKIDQFADAQILKKEQGKLLALQERIDSSLKLVSRVEKLEQKLQEPSLSQPKTDAKKRSSHHLSDNIYSFHANGKANKKPHVLQDGLEKITYHVNNKA